MRDFSKNIKFCVLWGFYFLHVRTFSYKLALFLNMRLFWYTSKLCGPQGSFSYVCFMILHIFKKLMHLQTISNYSMIFFYTLASFCIWIQTVFFFRLFYLNPFLSFFCYTLAQQLNFYIIWIIFLTKFVNLWLFVPASWNFLFSHICAYFSILFAFSYLSLFSTFLYFFLKFKLVSG